MLQGHNIRDIVKRKTKTKHDGYLLYKAYDGLKKAEESIEFDIGRIHGMSKGLTWTYLERHLKREYPGLHTQFSTVDEEGFKLAGRHPFDVWVPAVSPQELDGIQPAQNIRLILQKAASGIFSLGVAERKELVKVWMKELHDTQFSQLFDALSEARTTQKTIHNIHQEGDRTVLQDADVIGITTTGLAKNVELLGRINSKVVICEEAGEVLESHVLSTFLSSVEHVIQIGDHEQLRPSVTNFSLSIESHEGVQYKLDRSQFERLVVGEPGRLRIPVAQLDVQRRMRPEISRLIRKTLYPSLKDHTATLNRPDVVGMRKNVFWLDHKNLEDGQQSESHHLQSKSNQWEVEMVHALVRHVVRQGTYSSNDIAVLTPYTGQIQKLRAALRNDFEVVLSDRDEEALAKDGLAENEQSAEIEHALRTNQRAVLTRKKLSDMLRVATVDNFQGEEAKIVIISLVRSNDNQKVGFLKTTNRINVLLSRAKHGMYILGNSETYSKVPMWRDVVEMLRADGSFGDSLELSCPRHPDTPIQVSCPADFARMSPEGGCRLPCERRLPDCGHKWFAVCHSDSVHKAYVCLQRCERLHHPCNHACRKATCGEGMYAPIVKCCSY
jgi:AAA domain